MEIKLTNQEVGLLKSILKNELDNISHYKSLDARMGECPDPKWDKRAKEVHKLRAKLNVKNA